MNAPAGCKLEPFDQSACRRWLAWVFGRSPISWPEDAWLLGHCDDGVTWGRFERGVWRFASEVFPDLCPRLSPINVQEVRIFSAEQELHLWRSEDGFRGRTVRDEGSFEANDPIRPDDEPRILLGDRVLEVRDGFTRVADGTGAEQAVPFELPPAHQIHPTRRPKLWVRHYFSRDAESGIVRVVLTRLVKLEVPS